MATLLTVFRRFAATAYALTAGLWNVAAHRGRRTNVVLRPGDRAPDFTLRASDGRTYRLAQFAGRQPVVVAWFPKAFTPGCTAECSSIGRNGPALRSSDAAYFGASVDSAATNRAFAQSMGIDFPILSDPEKKTARAYGVLGASGFPSRWTFYIDRDGRILAIDKQVRTSTHGSDIARMLEDMKNPRT